jgi:hypothetical protein
MFIGDERRVLEAMEIYFIPAGVIHGWKTFDVRPGFWISRRNQTEPSWFIGIYHLLKTENNLSARVIAGISPRISTDVGPP